MGEITAGELLLKCLKQEGVSTLFGVLDGSYNPFLEKLDKYGMRFINARHEAAAAHMAEGWARVRGEPAVVFGGIGPGATNLISGVITAGAEGSPLIVFSGQRRRSLIYPARAGSFQNLDLLSLYRPATLWSAGARDWKRLPELVRRAYQEATAGRPGPVYLELPEDLLKSKGEEDSVAVWPACRGPGGSSAAGDPALIEAAAELLAGSRRPLLHAGTGVSWSGAWDEFVALGDHLSAALTCSLGGRGVIPEDHPRFLHPLNREALTAARSEADVVLTVGGRMGELDGWGKPPTWGPLESQKVIQVDIDPTSIGANRPVQFGIVGDAKAVLAALLKAVRLRTSARPEHSGFSAYRSLTATWKQELEDSLSVGSGSINPGQMIRIVRDFYPRDAILAMDGGNTSLWTASHFPVLSPRGCLFAAKTGHLGTGLPYAIGASLAAPERPVCLISGDGAIGFNIQELETAARHNVPIVVVVSCDQGWGMERTSQLFAGIETPVECDIHPGARYDLVAEALGCHGELVENLDQLRPALERSTASGKPALIQVMVDHLANMAPPGIMVFGQLRAVD